MTQSEIEALRSALNIRNRWRPSRMAIAQELGIEVVVIENFSATRGVRLAPELLLGLDRILKRAPPPPLTVAAPKQQVVPPDTRTVMKLHARALKVTAVLDAAELATLSVPDTTRVTLQVTVAGGRVVTADVAAKSVRKCKAVISEHGADGVALLIQGKLGGGNEVLEAGLVAQVKAPRPTVDG